MDELALYSTNELEDISSALYNMAETPKFILHNCANNTDIGDELANLYSACREFVACYESSVKKG